MVYRCMSKKGGNKMIVCICRGSYRVCMSDICGMDIQSMMLVCK